MPKLQQSLISTWFSKTSDRQAPFANPFHSLRGRRGPVQPCCQTVKEREKAIKLAKLREANKKLKAFAEEKATQAAKAMELACQEVSFTHAAVREMRSNTAQLMHEEEPGQADSACAARSEPHGQQQPATVERLDTAVSNRTVEYRCCRAVGDRWFYFFERLEDRCCHCRAVGYRCFKSSG